MTSKHDQYTAIARKTAVLIMARPDQNSIRSVQEIVHAALIMADRIEPSGLLTTAEVAARYGISANATHKMMGRYGVVPVARQVGRSGQSLWDWYEIEHKLGYTEGEHHD